MGIYRPCLIVYVCGRLLTEGIFRVPYVFFVSLVTQTIVPKFMKSSLFLETKTKTYSNEN